MHVKFMTELNLIEALYLLLQLQVPTLLFMRLNLLNPHYGLARKTNYGQAAFKFKR